MIIHQIVYLPITFEIKNENFSKQQLTNTLIVVTITSTVETTVKSKEWVIKTILFIL